MYVPGCKLPSGINTCVEEEMEKVEIGFGKLALILVGEGGCHLLKGPWASAM